MFDPNIKTFLGTNFKGSVPLLFMAGIKFYRIRFWEFDRVCLETDCSHCTLQCALHELDSMVSSLTWVVFKCLPVIYSQVKYTQVFYTSNLLNFGTKPQFVNLGNFFCVIQLSNDPTLCQICQVCLLRNFAKFFKVSKK